MQRITIEISRDEEKKLIENLRKEDTINAQRILKNYDMPDLSRTKWNPVEMVTEAFKNIDIFKDFDIIETPEIVGVYETFDLFNFKPDHPARSKSDTYYVTDDKILRTHTTVMWYYYFNYPEIKEKLENDGEIWVLSHGKVYRKDEIDRSHFPIFHQIDWLYICNKEKQIIGKEDLIKVLVIMAKSLYGENVEYKVLDDTFPYTDPSIQIEIKFWDQRLEILWSWVVHPTVLDNLWVDSNKYNWWAFGPWIERLAMIKKWIPDIRILWSQDPRITKQWWNLDTKYEDVSKYPETYRDISFILDKSISLNALFEIIRDEAWDLVEEVTQLDKYDNAEKFGNNNISYTFRIIYRSHERTLLNDEINDIQLRIREKTANMLNAQLR